MSDTHHCRFCHTPLDHPFIDLGAQPLANNYLKPGEEASERRFPLIVHACPACLLVQADHSVPADAIFTADYAYFSSYSTSWVEHARLYAEVMIKRFYLGPSSLVAEVASNDGYLLQHFQGAGIPVLGIEPTKGTADAAIAKGIPTEIAFFDKNLAAKLMMSGKHADLIAANNVLAHVPNIRDFVGGFTVMLKPEGVATFEFPHLLNMIRKVQFDTIYHEHYSYLSLYAVNHIVGECGLRVFDVEHLPTHGGSLRVYVCRKGAHYPTSGHVQAVLSEERDIGLDRPDGAGYRNFAGLAAHARQSFKSFLETAQRDGKTVMGYGAAAKGNTFLNFCGITPADMPFVADASHAKQGKLLPGTHIPVISPADLLAKKPDYVVILPWNLADEISKQMAGIRAWGGQFVTAIPEAKILP